MVKIKKLKWRFFFSNIVRNFSQYFLLQNFSFFRSLHISNSQKFSNVNKKWFAAKNQTYMEKKFRSEYFAMEIFFQVQFWLQKSVIWNVVCKKKIPETFRWKNIEIGYKIGFSFNRKCFCIIFLNYYSKVKKGFVIVNYRIKSNKKTYICIILKAFHAKKIHFFLS